MQEILVFMLYNIFCGSCSSVWLLVDLCLMFHAVNCYFGEKIYRIWRYFFLLE